MLSVALAGPEDTNIIYVSEQYEATALWMKNQKENMGRSASVIDATQYGNEIERVRRFTTPNYKLRSRVTDSDIVIVTGLHNANKKTLDALTELVNHRTIDGVEVSGVEAVIFLVPDLKSPNVKKLQKFASR